MQIFKITWKNHRRMLRTTAVLLLALCVLFLAGQWYKLYKDRQAQEQAWFDAEGEKLLAFAKLGKQQLDADVSRPGIEKVVEKMQATFDPQKTRTFENADHVTSTDEKLLYDGRISIYYDEDGDQICAYGDTAILGFRCPVYVNGYNQALSYAFPYMKPISPSIYYFCIDPDQSKFEAFDDVATELLQTGNTRAEKDGYTFKKCYVELYDGIQTTVIITRKTPASLPFYAKTLVPMGLVSLGICEVALLVLFGWLCILEMRATKIEESTEPSEKAIKHHREFAAGLLALLDDAVNSLGPKMEFDEIRNTIDQVKEDGPAMDKKQGPGENGRRFLRLHRTIAQVVVLILAVIAILIVSSFIQYSDVERRLDEEIDQRLLTDQAFAAADYSDNALMGYEGQTDVVRVFANNYYFGSVVLEKNAHSLGWLFETKRTVHTVTTENDGDLDPEGEILDSSGLNDGVFFIEWNGTPQLGENATIEFDESGQAVLVRGKGDETIKIIYMQLGGDDSEELTQYGYASYRPDFTNYEEFAFLPVFCDKNGDFLSFFEGKLFYTSMINCAGTVSLDERFADQAGSIDSLALSCGISSEARRNAGTDSASVFSLADWRAKIMDLLLSGQTSGWSDDYRFHRIDIESSRSLPSLKGQLAFVDGAEAWQEWVNGVVENAIILATLLIVIEIVAVFIRKKNPDISVLPDQEDQEEGNDISSAEREVWTPVLTAIENAEATLGNIGYLEDIRKKIGG